MTIEELAEALGIELTDDARGAIDGYTNDITAALKANRDKWKREKHKAQSDLAAYQALDLDDVRDALGIEDGDDFELSDLSDRIRSVKAAATKTDGKDDPRIADLERKLERARAKAGEDIAAAQTERDLLAKRLMDREVEAQALEAIAKKKGSAKLLLPHVRNRIKAEIGEDGSVELIVLAPNGEPMVAENGADGTISDLIEEFARSDDFGPAFAADMPGGTGARKPGGVRGTRNPWAKDTFNLTEQARIEQESPALAKTLKEQAA